MIKLEDIGFYTLSNKRALNSSSKSPLWRCELILTDKCNFKCPYCRGLRQDCSGDVPFEEAEKIIKIWISEGLKNIRFSGGEPTLYDKLLDLVSLCKEGNVERIAISTNGSANIQLYKDLYEAGVNDFSISLDGCCALVGDMMAGGIKGAWQKVINNIQEISKFSYVTLGMVFTDKNINQCKESVLFADSLGVSDIRVIPSAQYNKALMILSTLPIDILNKYPILKYRIKNLEIGKHVRGLNEKDCRSCWLGLDDMVVADGKNGLKHFPCIIYLREGGDCIADINGNMRQEREDWVMSHNSFLDPICRKNCLDVCIDFNNVANRRKNNK